MAWIEIIPPESATGALKQQYDKADQRAARVWNIVSIMSQNPATMKSSMELYKTIMFGPSELSRAQREMLAVVVSTQNKCIY